MTIETDYNNNVDVANFMQHKDCKVISMAMKHLADEMHISKIVFAIDLDDNNIHFEFDQENAAKEIEFMDKQG